MAGSYRQAGVDIDAGNAAVAAMREHVRSTFNTSVLSEVGGFGGLYAFQGTGDSVLVASTDSVGTKVMLAFALDRHDTIGEDLVNHCVNDILVCGARPLFFLDYLGVGHVVPSQIEQLVSGIARGCRSNGCALIGGETAELPGLYQPGQYDVAGFIVGTVERSRLLTGMAVREGDVILGLPSSGLHTNGYSLARRIVGLTGDTAHDRALLERYEPELGATWADVLLAVHRSYLPSIWPLLEAQQVKSLAHITGGGLMDNVPRTLPDGLAAVFQDGTWPIPPVFTILEARGSVDRAEMYRVFNMGLGLVLVCSPEHAAAIQAQVPDAMRVGHIAVHQPGMPRVTIEQQQARA